MTADLPAFSFDGQEVLAAEPRALLDEGAVFGMVAGAHAGGVEPLMTVAWVEEPAGTLEEAVEEDLARMLSQPGSVLVDLESTTVGGVASVRTFVLHLAGGGLTTASEQWRLLAGGRRWTVSAMTALEDQPEWGPRLAAIAVTFRAG